MILSWPSLLNRTMNLPDHAMRDVIGGLNKMADHEPGKVGSVLDGDLVVRTAWSAALVTAERAVERERQKLARDSRDPRD